MNNYVMNVAKVKKTLPLIAIGRKQFILFKQWFAIAGQWTSIGLL